MDPSKEDVDGKSPRLSQLLGSSPSLLFNFNSPRWHGSLEAGFGLPLGDLSDLERIRSPDLRLLEDDGTSSAFPFGQPLNASAPPSASNQGLANRPFGSIPQLGSFSMPSSFDQQSHNQQLQGGGATGAGAGAGAGGGIPNPTAATLAQAGRFPLVQPNDALALQNLSMLQQQLRSQQQQQQQAFAAGLMNVNPFLSLNDAATSLATWQHQQLLNLGLGGLGNLFGNQNLAQGLLPPPTQHAQQVQVQAQPHSQIPHLPQGTQPSALHTQQRQVPFTARRQQQGQGQMPSQVMGVGAGDLQGHVQPAGRATAAAPPSTSAVAAPQAGQGLGFGLPPNAVAAKQLTQYDIRSSRVVLPRSGLELLLPDACQQPNFDVILEVPNPNAAQGGAALPTLRFHCQIRSWQNGTNRRMYVLEKTGDVVTAVGLKVGDRVVLLLEGTEAATNTPVIRAEINTPRAIECASIFATKFGRGSVNTGAVTGNDVGAGGAGGAGPSSGGGGPSGAKRKSTAASSAPSAKKAKTGPRPNSNTGAAAAQAVASIPRASTQLVFPESGASPQPGGGSPLMGGSPAPGAAGTGNALQGSSPEDGSGGPKTEGASPSSFPTNVSKPPPIFPGYIASKNLTNYDCSSGRMVLNRSLLQAAIPSINSAKPFVLNARSPSGTVYPLLFKSWANSSNAKVHVMEGIGPLVTSHNLRPGDKLGVVCETDGTIRLELGSTAAAEGGAGGQALNTTPATDAATGGPGAPGTAAGTAGGVGAGRPGAPHHHSLPKDLPTRVKVVCGALEGHFLPHLLVVAVKATEVPREDGAVAATPQQETTMETAAGSGTNAPGAAEPAATALTPASNSPSNSSKVQSGAPAVTPLPVRENHITLPEFEKIAGKAHVRKWKETVHVVQERGDGTVAREPLGVWLSKRDLIVKGRTLVHVEPDDPKEDEPQDDEELAGLLMALRKDGTAPGTSSKPPGPPTGLRRAQSANNLAAGAGGATGTAAIAQPTAPGVATAGGGPIPGAAAQGPGGQAQGGLGGADSPLVGAARRKRKGLPRSGSKVIAGATSSSSDGGHSGGEPHVPRGGSEPLPGTLSSHGMHFWPSLLPQQPGAVAAPGLAELKERLLKIAKTAADRAPTGRPSGHGETTGALPLTLDLPPGPEGPSTALHMMQVDPVVIADVRLPPSKLAEKAGIQPREEGTATTSAFQPYRSPPGGSSPVLGASPPLSFMNFHQTHPANPPHFRMPELLMSPGLQEVVSPVSMSARPPAFNQAALANPNPAGPPRPDLSAVQNPVPARVVTEDDEEDGQQKPLGDSAQSSETALGGGGGRGNREAGHSPPAPTSNPGPVDLSMLDNPLRALQSRLQARVPPAPVAAPAPAPDLTTIPGILRAVNPSTGSEFFNLLQRLQAQSNVQREQQ